MDERAATKETENLANGDYVMAFDPEFDVWFKYKVLKATANYYVVWIA